MGKEQYGCTTPKPRIKSVTQWLWVAMAIIGFLILIAGAMRAQRILASRGWPEIDGLVVTSELERGYMREGGLKYKYQIRYRYTVDGVTYHSERLSFGVPHPARQDVRSLPARYPPGRLVVVHYKPSDPSMAVLGTDSSWRGYRPLVFGLVITCIGVAGFWFRWPLQTDYLFRERDPDQPFTYWVVILGLLGLLTCIGIGWLWWELIKMYAGR